MREQNVTGKAMRLGVVLLAGAAMATVAARSPAQQDDAATALDAQQLYQAKCAGCHGSSGQGGEFGGALRGPAFEAKWKSQSEQALEQFIAQNMPPAEPGSLPGSAYHALAKYLWSGMKAPEAVAPAASPATSTKPDENADGYDESEEAFDLLTATPNKDAVYDAAMRERQAKLDAMAVVDENMLANPPADDWLSVRRTYDSAGFSPLKSINAQNVGDLRVAWSLALPNGSNGISPLAHDGVLFVNSSGTVLALDAETSDVLWRFSRRAESLPQQGPPITQPRGMALFGETLYVPTVDSHLLALDMRTGKQIWDTAMAPSGGALRVSTAPIVARGKVIVGLSGCSESGDCAVVALDANTGKEAWRVRTIAKAGTKDGNSWAGLPDDKRSGGSIWAPASYDPVSNLVYVGTAATYHIEPLMTAPEGANNAALYTDATLAIDPDTGELKWHYQHMRRDVWDLDWAFERVVMEIPDKKGTRRVVATMGKLGILDVLDARTGRYLYSYDLGYQNLVTRIDPKTGEKHTDPALEPSVDGRKNCPYTIGVRNWPYTSFDPGTNKMYIPYLRTCQTFVWNRGRDIDIGWYYEPPEGPDRSSGGVVALDVSGKSIAWNSKMRAATLSATLPTAGGVVFSAGGDRYFRAQNSSTGELLWQLRLDQQAAAAPITFMANGEQYVVITTGAGNPLEMVTRPLTPENDPAGPGVRLWAFKVPKGDVGK